MGSKSKKNKNSAKKNPDANMAVEVSGNRVFGGGNKVITDDRFALSQKDPRFQDVPKHKTKVAIDSRFSRMFTDKNFSTSSARVDKRGRTKQDGDSSQSALKHYYRMDGEEKKQKKQREKSNDDEVENHEENEESESDDAEKLKKVRQTLPKSKSKPESESETESSGEDDEEEEGEEDLTDDYTSTDTDEEDEAYVEEEPLQPQENIPTIDKETHRLAIVDMDWSQVRAVDLFVVLSSFLPKTGQILSVSVYPTDFGLKQMEEEAVRGPVGLFDDENKDNDSDNSDNDNEIDNEKLRTYELSRLRYYVAVVVCDSVSTADYIYTTCDGIEFERSSNTLDLRFIPDSLEFKNPPRDVATEAPDNYEGIDFQTRALQQTKIDLTWDENEPQRSKKFKRKINVDKDIEQLEEFIASSESDTEEEEDENNKNSGKRQKTDAYRALLHSGSNSNSDNEEDTGMEMEVTFNTGLEAISKKILEKKDKESETVWDAYLRKKKEKKKARKNKSMDSDGTDDSDREPVEESGDFFAGDSVKKDKKRKKPELESELELDKENEASKAELELLLGDDEGNVKGYNLKKKKSKGQKGKKGKSEGMDEEKIPTVDYDDPRFSSLFNRPDYALDPTDPQFKRSAAYVRQVAHKQHKGDVDREGEHDEYEANEGSKVDNKMDSKKDKHEISMLLKSVKMKSKQLQVSSDGKKSKRKGK